MGEPVHDNSRDGAGLGGDTLRAALDALGIVVLVREPSGLRLSGAAPEWIGRLWPSWLSGDADIGGVSPFLENFLIDAEACWSQEGGRVRSGPWVEYDKQGRPVDLEATAMTVGGRALLTIELLGDEFQETRAVLQRARETMLAYQRLAQPHPPEISISLARLRERFPNYARCGFLIMRFVQTEPYRRILKSIEDTAAAHGLSIVRADAHVLHSDLLSNVRTYLHGCSFGVAVYDRIESEEHNANVGLEVGYLMALNKPVLLLKDRTVPRLQEDLAGRLYRVFDPYNPEETIPSVLTRWLQDQGIVVQRSE